MGRLKRRKARLKKLCLAFAEEHGLSPQDWLNRYKDVDTSSHNMTRMYASCLVGPRIR